MSRNARTKCVHRHLDENNISPTTSVKRWRYIYGPSPFLSISSTSSQKLACQVSHKQNLNRSLKQVFQHEKPCTTISKLHLETWGTPMRTSKSFSFNLPQRLSNNTRSQKGWHAGHYQLWIVWLNLSNMEFLSSNSCFLSFLPSNQPASRAPITDPHQQPLPSQARFQNDDVTAALFSLIFARPWIVFK